MAKETKTFIDHSKVNWSISIDEGAYPGVERLQIGCLQRIATASEVMAKSHVQLQADRDLYKLWYDNERAENASLLKSNAALRGVIGRMKRQKLA